MDKILSEISGNFKSPWYGGPIGPVGYLKASLTEPLRQEMQ